MEEEEEESVWGGGGAGLWRRRRRRRRRRSRSGEVQTDAPTQLGFLTFLADSQRGQRSSIQEASLPEEMRCIRPEQEHSKHP